MCIFAWLALVGVDAAVAASPRPTGLLRKSSTVTTAIAARNDDGTVEGTVTSISQETSFRYTLRVCNGYPYAAALHVDRGTERLTAAGGALSYKQCADFEPNLHTDDRLLFTVGEAKAGTFQISDLPRSDALLLLVIHRHDALSTAASFESHVFTDVGSPQLAVVDTFRGGVPRTRLAIADRSGDESTAAAAREEPLRFNSVVAVNPGNYEVRLEEGVVSPGATGKANGSSASHVVGRTPLVALRKSAYVVMRVGVESQAGPSYPEEVVVFPESSATDLTNSGTGSAAVWAALTAGVLAMLR